MTELDEARTLIADACRVLAARGLANGFLGHISMRVSQDLLLIRCRGPRERGLAWTTAADVRLVDLDGNPGAAGELDDWSVPNELPLHTAVLRSDHRITSVVHAHPPSVVAADLAGQRIRPIVGAYDIPGAKLAAAGVPVYPRGVLIRTQALASEMVQAMAGHCVVVLRGHGLTTTGSSVQEAVLRAASVNSIAQMTLAIVGAGGTIADLPEADLTELPDLGSAFNEGVAWRHELARLGSPPGGIDC